MKADGRKQSAHCGRARHWCGSGCAQSLRLYQISISSWLHSARGSESRFAWACIHFLSAMTAERGNFTVTVIFPICLASVSSHLLCFYALPDLPMSRLESHCFTCLLGGFLTIDLVHQSQFLPRSCVLSYCTCKHNHSL